MSTSNTAKSVRSEAHRPGGLAKKIAGYHQFHAVEVAIDETLQAAELRDEQDFRSGAAEPSATNRKPGGALGDRRIGVVWHTQGSGKSLTMAFYAGRIIREPAMANPTVVVLTDRNDLDDQLFSTFSRCSDLLRQPPVQADSRTDLQTKLTVESGGVVFTTIQKFFPEERGDRYPTLSDSRNIVVIAAELVDTVRNSVTIDWTLRENVRARIRTLVKRILRKHGYPPDKQEQAT